MSRESKRCLILGTGGHCRALLSIAQEPHNRVFSIEGILETGPARGKESILGVDVTGSTDELENFFARGIECLLLAIGDNSRRRHFYNAAKRIGFAIPNVIAQGSYIAPSACLGDGNLVCHRVHIGPMARIGNGNILNTGSILEHESTVGNFCHLAPSSVMSGRSHLGNSVFLGVNAMVIDKINVCDDVTIGAGAVVVKDISVPGGTFVGVPAKELMKK